MDFLTLRDSFEETFLSLKEKTALTFLRGSIVESRLTYGTLDKDTDRMARFLYDLGVKEGDGVILFFPESVLSVVIRLALLKMGAIGVPLNAGFKKSEMDYLGRIPSHASSLQGFRNPL
jgi:long-chain acyl-CoA synthetase